MKRKYRRGGRRMIFQSADFECAFSSYRLPDEKIIPIFAAVMAKCLSYLVFALCLFLWDFSFSTAEGDMACMPSTTIMEAGDGGETDTKYCGQDKEIRAGFGWGDIGYALLSCPIGHSIQAMRSFKGHTACAGWKNGVWQVAALWLPERGEKLPDTSFSNNAKLYFVYTLRRILI